MLNELLNDQIVFDQLFELRKFILAEDIWQRKLLDSSSFGSKMQEYGINGRLWSKELYIFSRYGLIKADQVSLNSDKQIDYLLSIKQYDGCQTGLFTSIEDTSKIDLTCLSKQNNEPPTDYQLYFHPYRIYGVNRLFTLVERRIVSYQPFLDIDGLKRLNKKLEDEIESYLKSKEIWRDIRFYNGLIDLCIISEVAFRAEIFQKISYSTEEETVRLRDELRASLKELYKTIGLDTIELLRKWLVTEAEREDPNATVHALLRMMNSDERLRLTGKLGLSMLLLEMAEVLQRAAEYYFERNLDEENKVLGRGYFDDFMKKQFGTVRVLDNPLSKTEFIRFLGLDYTLRAKIYVEGVTEYGYLEEVFAGIHAIQIIDLGGQFTERGGKGIAFRESLREDQRLHLFSFVFIDADVKKNIDAVKKAVSDEEFFGMFFKSDPDFEFGNFSPDDLYSAFLCSHPDLEDKKQEFLAKKSNIRSGKNFVSVVNELYPNERFSKSKEWGKALYKLTIQQPAQKEPKFAKLLEFVRKIHISLQSGYEWHKQKYKVDPNTGLLIDKIRQIDSWQIDASPTKELFIDMLVRDISLNRAIIDLVDNSVEGALRLRPNGDYTGLTVHVELNSEHLKIVDNCGGIPVKTARDYAFRFGRPKDAESIPRSIGQFGIGMKRTLFKLGRKFRVESTTESSYFVIEEDVDEWKQKTDWHLRFNKLEENSTDIVPEHLGTKIEVTFLYEDISNHFKLGNFQNRLFLELREAHSLNLEKGLAITLNGISVKVERPIALLYSEQLKPACQEITYTNQGNSPVKVKILAGIAEPHLQRGGWYIFCNDRMVLEADQTMTTGWGEANGAMIPKYHPDFAYFRGYVFFESDDAGLLPWTTTKSGINTDAAMFQSVRGKMMTLMRPVLDFLRQLATEKSRMESGDVADNPLELALEAAKLKKYSEIENTETVFQSPDSASLSPSEHQMSVITYKKSEEEIKQVKEVLKVRTNKAVGEQTFDYFFKLECDE